MGWLTKTAMTALATATVWAIAKNHNENKEREEEEERARCATEKRRKSICLFDNGISEERFAEIVRKSTRRIRRIENYIIDGTDVYCTVFSQSGASKWKFKLDYNDYGEVTGKHWILTENDDSNIPIHLAQMIQGIIEAEISSEKKSFKKEIAAEDVEGQDAESDCNEESDEQEKSAGQERAEKLVAWFFRKGTNIRKIEKVFKIIAWTTLAIIFVVYFCCK